MHKSGKLIPYTGIPTIVHETMLKIFLPILLVATFAIGQQRDLPNVVLILTDDLDSELGGDEPLTKTHSWINQNGVDFSNAFVNVPICCPSRSSLLTGLHQHNHGVVNNSVSGDCSGEAWRQGPETQSFASYLKGAGYVSFYAGKYLNQYGFEQGGGIAHVPNGWDFWAGLVGNSRYYDYTLSVNGKPEIHASDYAEDYLTDVIGRKADSFLDFYFDQIGTNNLPFLMVLSTPACHDPFTPAPQYEDSYSGSTAPRTPAFNYLEEDEGANPKHWFVNQGPRPLDDAILEEVDAIYRDRLRTMLSVDDMVDGLMTRLESEGVLDNTFVIFTSDHGYHLGEFSLHKDKRQPYEFDTKIPLSVRGPGVRLNVMEDTLISLVDLAPTILDMAKVEVPSDIDGTSFLPWLLETNEVDEPTGQESILISYHGEGYADMECDEEFYPNMAGCEVEFDCKCQDTFNNTFTCVRTINDVENSIYCQFEEDILFEEFYDINNDPYQLLNVAPELDAETRSSYIAKLDTLRTCSGSSQCYQPIQSQQHQQTLAEWLDLPKIFEKISHLFSM